MLETENLKAFYNPSQNIWQKLKKYSKIGQDFKNVILCVF